MRPGPGRQGRRFFPPIARFSPEEFEASFPLTIHGPVDRLGEFQFEGTVTLTPAMVDRPNADPYLFIIKRWTDGPERAEASSEHECSAGEFARVMRTSGLEVGVDKFATARVFRNRSRWFWEKQLGIAPPPHRNR